MRRALILAVIPLLAALTLPSPAGAFERPPGDDDVPDASASPGEAPCLAPVPTLVYDTDFVSYGVEVDLAGCDWWDGTEIELSATIERFDGIDDEGTNVATVCGGLIVTYAEDGSPMETPVADSCGVNLEMEHPSVEVARYRGEVTYPWEGTIEAETFEIFCVSTPLEVHCENSDPTFDMLCVFTDVTGRHCQDMPQTGS